MQILVISKKLVNKLHSVGLVTSLWLGVTNETSNFIMIMIMIIYWVETAQLIIDPGNYRQKNI